MEDLGSTISPPKLKKIALLKWCQDHALIPLVIKQLAQEEYNLKYAENT
jgi:hypothetical protein